jgi:hypothetical protein
MQSQAMFPNLPHRYQSSTDLNVKKIEMREELEDAGLAIQQDVSEENLLRQKQRAQYVEVFAKQTDPEMAKRAKLLIQQIDTKLTPRIPTPAQRNLTPRFLEK